MKSVKFVPFCGLQVFVELWFKEKRQFIQNGKLPLILI